MTHVRMRALLLSLLSAAFLLLQLFGLSGCSSARRLQDPAGFPFEEGTEIWLTALKHKLGGANAATDQPKPLPGADTVQEYVDDAFGSIDEYHIRYKNQLHMDIANGATFFDVSTLGTTFATTIVGGAASKTILGAVGTLTTGTGLAIKKNYLNDQTSLAIISTMDAARAARRLQIQLRLAERGTRPYTRKQAENDLLLYFMDGSVVNAIQRLYDKAAEEKVANEAKLENTYIATYDAKGTTRPLLDRIGRWVRENRTERLKTVADWIKTNQSDYKGFAFQWIEDSSVKADVLEKFIGEHHIP